MRALDAADLAVADLQLHQPSLDDVFLAKTGRKLESRRERSPRRSPAVILQQSVEMARRSILQTLRQPAMVIPPVLFPLILMGINVGGLDAATNIPGFPTDSYLDFAIAFPFIQGSLFASINAGSAVARDVETGFLNRLALTPMQRAAMLLGNLSGVMVVALISSLIYLAVGFAAGLHFETGVLGVIVLLVLALLIALAFASIGAFIGLRTGSGEAVQGVFPLFFVFLFLSSSSLPRDLIEQDWFRTIATYNPISYLFEGLRSLIIFGWQGQELALGFGFATVIALIGVARLGLGPAHEAGADMRRFADVTGGVAWRSTKKVWTNPQLLLPSLIFPLFFFVAFAGGLSSVGDVPGFDFPSGYTAFQFVFVLLQASAFGGVFTGFGIASDFENGFARRMMLAAPNRLGILAGYALSATTRAVAVGIMLFVVALATGMQIGGGGVDLFGLVVLALLVNLTAAMWAAGIALRFRTIQAGPIMQMPVFIILFLAPVYVPLDLLGGWVEAVAHVNPFTALVEGGRDLISGQSFDVGLMYLIAVVLLLVFTAFGVRGLRRAEAAG